MTVESHEVRVYYCPRCDKPFADTKSNNRAFKEMDNHVREAHRDYYDTLYQDG